MSNTIDTLLTAKESSMIAEIIVSFSLLDEALCAFLLGYPSKNSYLEEITTGIKKDPSNVGIRKKIGLVVDLFPNNSTLVLKI
jgi:predicted transcriptional regulator with HTH domain